jgi:hypothetical protein
MSEYDKELQSNTKHYEEETKPLDNRTHTSRTPDTDTSSREEQDEEKAEREFRENG